MRRLSMLLLVFVIATAAVSQEAKKIKYKDIFPLLDAKDYAASEKLLRLYLSLEKNQDEANPNYQMGLIYQYYFLNGDILNDTSTVVAMADSAVIFLGIAKGLIDEKELRKNDEYYQSFYRRDLRTGEFGIKLSDVHLDIEKLIESTQERVNLIRELHVELVNLQNVEKEMIEAYNTMVSEYGNLNELVMAADLPEISDLGDLKDFQFKMTEIGEKIASLAASLNVEGSYDEISLQSINGYTAVEPILSTLDGSLETWDIDSWVDEVKGTINGDVASLKKQIEDIDEELSEAKENITKQTEGIFPLVLDNSLIEQIEKFGNYRAPLTLLEARILENVILSVSDTVLNPDINDTTLISYQLEVSDSLFRLAGKLRELASNKSAELLESEKYFGNYYRNRYESVENAAAYMAQMSQFAIDQQIKWDTLQTYWDFRNNWGVLETDTIPLIEVDSGRYKGVYDVIATVPVNEFEVLAFGVDSSKHLGFAARFGSDRRALWELNFESSILTPESEYQFEYDTITSGIDDIAFYWFNADSTLENNMTIVSISLEGELNWSTSIQARKKPVYASYSDAIKQHTLFLYPQEVYPLPGDELGYIVIDRNGEAK